MKQTTLEERSAGGVVYRQGKDGVEFLLGKHSGYHKWVLPKGLVEQGESAPEAAVREVEEEVGVEARIVDLAPLKTIEYWFFADPDTSGETTRRVLKYQEQGGKKVRVHKYVTFYLMELAADKKKTGWEMEAREWVSYAEGMEKLAFETEREVLQSAGKALALVV